MCKEHQQHTKFGDNLMMVYNRTHYKLTKKKTILKKFKTIYMYITLMYANITYNGQAIHFHKAIVGTNLRTPPVVALYVMVAVVELVTFHTGEAPALYWVGGVLF